MRLCGYAVRRLLILVLLSAPWALRAQQFTLNGTCTQPVKGRVSLVIYDGDTTYRILRSATKGSTFSFVGSVDRPVLAELYHKDFPQSLYFYLENSDITVSLDVEHPAASPVQGSRINSQYRYALEQCQGEGREHCMKQWLTTNPTSIFAPFVLNELSLTDYAEVQALFAALQGDAKHTYHYHLLQRRLQRMQAVTEGQKMPDVVLPDSAGRPVHLDSLRADSSRVLLLVGARWCEQCVRIEAQLRRHSPQWGLRPVVVHLDSDPRGWNAPYVEQLSIDHIPYLILLDKAGTIVARDLRVWEIEKILDN